jgi:hypothetical protein
MQTRVEDTCHTSKSNSGAYASNIHPIYPKYLKIWLEILTIIFRMLEQVHPFIHILLTEICIGFILSGQ